MRTAFLVVGLVVVGCAGSPVTESVLPTPSGVAAAEPKLAKAADSGQVDKVGPSDGALSPDGVNDLGFVVDFQGPASALFLVGVDDAGAPTGSYQADTLVGDAESPKELGAKPGSGTLGLGVLEGAQLVNAKDGSLTALGDGAHQLTLYVAPSPAAVAGLKVRVYLQRPDKTLVPGATLTL